MTINLLSNLSTHVGEDLIILCAGNPYVDENGVLHGDENLFDEKNNLFQGSKIRWKASAKELTNTKYDRFILVGGSVKVDNKQYSKSEAMKLIIFKYLNISNEIKTNIENKITLLTSEPNTTGNCVSVKEFYDKTHYPKTIKILTNYWHMDRSILIFNNYFKDKYVNNIEKDNAEDILNFDDENCAIELHMTVDEYLHVIHNRTLMEQKGIKQILEGTYEPIKEPVINCM